MEGPMGTHLETGMLRQKQGVIVRKKNKKTRPCDQVKLKMIFLGF
jgi:hypothetical protein